MSRVDPSPGPSLDPLSRTPSTARTFAPAAAGSELSFVTQRPSRDEYLLASIGLDEALSRLGVADLVAKLEGRRTDAAPDA